MNCNVILCRLQLDPHSHPQIHILSSQTSVTHPYFHLTNRHTSKFWAHKQASQSTFPPTNKRHKSEISVHKQASRIHIFISRTATHPYFHLMNCHTSTLSAQKQASQIHVLTPQTSVTHPCNFILFNSTALMFGAKQHLLTYSRRNTLHPRVTFFFRLPIPATLTNKIKTSNTTRYLKTYQDTYSARLAPSVYNCSCLRFGRLKQTAHKRHTHSRHGALITLSFYFRKKATWLLQNNETS
jgi:hypothetical protein